jgi:hypothetical protein
MADFFLEPLKTLLGGTPGERVSKLATIVVPGIVLSCILSQFTGLGMLAGSENAITSVRLPMYLDLVSRRSDESAVAFIMEPEVGKFFIPWSHGSPVRVWLSVGSKTYDANTDQIKVRRDGIGGRFPLLGEIPKPVVLVAEGGEPGDPQLEGRSLKVDELGLYSREGVAKALWSFVISMFGFGLVIRSQGGETKPPADETSDKSAR